MEEKYNSKGREWTKAHVFESSRLELELSDKFVSLSLFMKPASRTCALNHDAPAILAPSTPFVSRKNLEEERGEKVVVREREMGRKIRGFFPGWGKSCGNEVWPRWSRRKISLNTFKAFHASHRDSSKLSIFRTGICENTCRDLIFT